jgi:hypothetical protein
MSFRRRLLPASPQYRRGRGNRRYCGVSESLRRRGFGLFRVCRGMRNPR